MPSNFDSNAVRAERAVLACFNVAGKMNDPLRIGSHDIFSDLVDSHRLQLAISALSAAIGSLAFRFANNERVCAKLKDLLDRCCEVQNARQLDEVVNSLIVVLVELGHSNI